MLLKTKQDHLYLKFEREGLSKQRNRMRQGSDKQKQGESEEQYFGLSVLEEHWERYERVHFRKNVS